LEEYIDIVTKDGIPTGKVAPKSIIHTKGYYHNTSHVWFYTKQGAILLSQRAASKSICPLLWDVSVAGHVDSGETIIDAAIRETKEEIGILVLEKNLKKIGVSKCFQTYANGIIDNEFHHTFISELPVSLNDLKLDKNEVESVKLVSLQTFKYLVDHIGFKNHFIPSNKAYYKFVLENIKEAIKK